MWRAVFLAVGISLTILGAQCFVVEKAVLTRKTDAEPSLGMPETNIVIEPPEWAPWSILSAGVLIVLYSFTLTRRG